MLELEGWWRLVICDLGLGIVADVVGRGSGSKKGGNFYHEKWKIVEDRSTAQLLNRVESRKELSVLVEDILFLKKLFAGCMLSPVTEDDRFQLLDVLLREGSVHQRRVTVGVGFCGRNSSATVRNRNKEITGLAGSWREGNRRRLKNADGERSG